MTSFPSRKYGAIKMGAKSESSTLFQNQSDLICDNYVGQLFRYHNFWQLFINKWDSLGEEKEGVLATSANLYVRKWNSYAILSPLQNVQLT